MDTLTSDTTSDLIDITKEKAKLSPGWLPGIPLDCEDRISDRYEK